MEHYLGLTLLGFIGGYELIFILVLIPIWIGLSILVGKLSARGIIGFWIAFLVSFFTTPVTGLIVALISILLANNKESITQSPHSVSSKMEELNKLKEKGLITDQEYQETKKKILNSL